MNSSLESKLEQLLERYEELGALLMQKSLPSKTCSEPIPGNMLKLSQLFSAIANTRVSRENLTKPRS